MINGFIITPNLTSSQRNLVPKCVITISTQLHQSFFFFLIARINILYLRGYLPDLRDLAISKNQRVKSNYKSDRSSVYKVGRGGWGSTHGSNSIIGAGREIRLLNRLLILRLACEQLHDTSRYRLWRFILLFSFPASHFIYLRIRRR